MPKLMGHVDDFQSTAVHDRLIYTDITVTGIVHDGKRAIFRQAGFDDLYILLSGKIIEGRMLPTMEPMLLQVESWLRSPASSVTRDSMEP